MLSIHLDAKEIWDDKNEVFINLPECNMMLEHSLLSISEWEKKYHKSFIDSSKNVEETIDYIKMMVVDGMPDDERVFLTLSKEQFNAINKYINDPMTATIITEEEEKLISDKNESKHKFTTSEEIYSWMCAQNIPFECERWHLNRLIILIKICAINNTPKDDKKKKMTSSDLALRRAKMDAARAKWAARTKH